MRPFLDSWMWVCKLTLTLLAVFILEMQFPGSLMILGPFSSTYIGAWRVGGGARGRLRAKFQKWGCAGMCRTKCFNWARAEKVSTVSSQWESLKTWEVVANREPSTRLNVLHMSTHLIPIAIPWDNPLGSGNSCQHEQRYRDAQVHRAGKSQSQEEPGSLASEFILPTTKFFCSSTLFMTQGLGVGWHMCTFLWLLGGKIFLLFLWWICPCTKREISG